jgi:hypothetical protein
MGGVCGIQHSIPDITCVREKGHDGFCRCKAYPSHIDGTITYTEWESRGGVFYRHVGYQTIYPTNMRKSQ